MNACVATPAAAAPRTLLDCLARLDHHEHLLDGYLSFGDGTTVAPRRLQLLSRTMGYILARDLGHWLGPVLLVLPGSAGWFFAFFALHRAGAVPVPVNDRLSPSRIIEVLRHTGARLVIHQAGEPVAGLAGRLPRVRFIAIEQLLARALQVPPHAYRMPGFTPRPGDPALIHHGAGDGQPLSHAGLLARVAGLAHRYRIGPGERMLCRLALDHAPGVLELALTSLLAGCRLHLSGDSPSRPTREGPSVRDWATFEIRAEGCSHPAPATTMAGPATR